MKENKNLLYPANLIYAIENNDSSGKEYIPIRFPLTELFDIRLKEMTDEKYAGRGYEILKLKFYENKTTEEIAEYFQISIPYINSAIRTMINRLSNYQKFCHLCDISKEQYTEHKRKDWYIYNINGLDKATRNFLKKNNYLTYGDLEDLGFVKMNKSFPSSVYNNLINALKENNFDIKPFTSSSHYNDILIAAGTHYNRYEIKLSSFKDKEDIIKFIREVMDNGIKDIRLLYDYKKEPILQINTKLLCS